MKLRQILEELVKKCMIGSLSKEIPSIDDTHFQILELFKEIVPKKLQDNQSHSPLGVNLSHNNGWNTAIDEINKKIEEL